MIIRFDDNLNVETLNFAEESIRVGNNLVNEIKIFMPQSFDISLYKAYLNFELNNGKQYNNIPTTMEFKTNEKETSEVCYYYPLQKFLSQQKGTLKLSVRISPINNIDIVANSGIITTNISYAITKDGQEVIDPTTEELLRQEILNMETNTKTNLQLYIDEKYGKINEEKLNKDFNAYENVTKPTTEDLISLRRQEKNVNIKVNDFYNILTINGITPVNKNIEIEAKNININDLTLEEKINSIDIETKASISLAKTKTSYRNGEIETIEGNVIPTGILSHITEEIFDVYDFARITLVDAEFQEGDLLTCDLNLTFVNNTGETTTTCSFTRLLAQGNFYQRMVVSTGTEIIPVSIYMIVNGSYLAMRVINTSEYAIKPSVEYAIIRR